jgi:hypothetical protein
VQLRTLPFGFQQLTYLFIHIPQDAENNAYVEPAAAGTSMLVPKVIEEKIYSLFRRCCGKNGWGSSRGTGTEVIQI